MILESHAHYTTAPFELDAWRGRQLGTLNRPSAGTLKLTDSQILDSLQGPIERMDALGIDATIFSPRASGMGHEIGDARVSLYWTQINNDLIARACSLVPGRLFPAGQLPQSPGVSPENCLGELQRCLDELGFVGFNVNPDVAAGGQPFTPGMSDAWWYPLYEALVEYDVPALIHASATLNPALHMNGSHYTSADAAVVFDLCWGDVYDRFPDLKIIVPHGGGALPFTWNRHRALHVQQGKPPFEERVKKLYFDTAVYDADAMEMLVRKVGPDNLLYASEPFGTAKAVDPETGRPFDETLGFFDGIEGLGDADREKILSGNALRLYTRIDPSAVGR